MAACKGCGSADPPNYPVPGDILILKMKMVVKLVVWRVNTLFALRLVGDADWRKDYDEQWTKNKLF